MPPSPFAAQQGNSSASIGWGVSGQTWQPASTQPTQVDGLSMKWYKFLIYFTCWASAAFAVMNAITYLVPNDAYYSWVSQISGFARVFDVLAGIFSIFVAAYAIYVRFRLSGYKQDAPLLISLLGAVNAVPSVLNLMGIGVTNLSGVGVANLMGTLLGAGCWYYLNRVYFGKRVSLFFNT